MQLPIVIVIVIIVLRCALVESSSRLLWVGFEGGLNGKSWLCAILDNRSKRALSRVPHSHLNLTLLSQYLILNMPWRIRHL